MKNNNVGADEPLRDAKDDRYALAPVAYHLARVIANLEGTGQVVAVNASWGGGKTSVVNLTRVLFKQQPVMSEAALEDYRPKRCPPKGFLEDVRKWRGSEITFVDFNAWLESGNEAMALSMIDTISDTLDDSGKAMQLGKKAFRHIRRNPGQLVKGAVSVFNVTSLALGSASQAEAQLDVDQLASSIEHDVTGLIKRIEQKGRRLVIVIDDIDRMPPERLQHLIIALWWIRDLPLISFLLLYDRNQVIDSLTRTMFRSSNEAEAKESAARFLEKIVQYSFDVPQPTRDQLLGALDKDLKASKWLGATASVKIPGLSSETFAGEQRWGAIQRYILRDLVNTPRAVKRLVLAAEISWMMREYVPIDIRDLVALEAVRLFRPKLFADIEDIGARIERGDNVARPWSDQEAIQAVLMPAHFRDDKNIPLESPTDVEARRGFGTQELMSHYLQGVPYPNISVLYNLEDFFHLRVTAFRETLVRAATERNLVPLTMAISAHIRDKRANGRTHNELAKYLYAAAESLDLSNASNVSLADSLKSQGDLYDV